MEPSILSLIPPVLALILVIITRKVLLSLGIGILLGALMVHQFNIVESFKHVAEIVTGIFYTESALNDWELYIILFLFMLGMMASLITLSGGSRAFGQWAISKVKTRVGAQLVAFFLGIIIFIDDYFNSLLVGNVSRPITDRHRVSRAKLAYIVDSTAAPVCVISPVSSWGAYIITIIAGILGTHAVTEYGAFQAFIYIVPMNLYAIFALLFVLAVILFRVDIGPMEAHETRAKQTGQLVDPEKVEIINIHDQGDHLKSGKVGELVWPLLTLVVSTVMWMIISGIQGTEGNVTLLSIFENTDVATSLVLGGFLGLVVAIIMSLAKKMSAKELGTGLWAGIKSMLPASFILLFAWTIIDIIDALGTGKYLASLIDGSIPVAFLPAILFIIAGFMAFSTGTSWGTFAVMLPIAGEISAVVDMNMLLPMLAAVLAGSIFGDHCSPISDTTILSSTGAGSHHIDHVLTQLPYALIIAGISIVGYLVLGLTGSIWIGLAAASVGLGGALLVMKSFSRSTVSVED